MLGKIFDFLGLTEKDKHIYIAALKVGAQPASVIARRTGYKRVDTYNHLQILCREGLCQAHLRGNIMHFLACPPGKLRRIVSNKKDLMIEAEKWLSSFRCEPEI